MGDNDIVYDITSTNKKTNKTRQLPTNNNKINISTAKLNASFVRFGGFSCVCVCVCCFIARLSVSSGLCCAVADGHFSANRVCMGAQPGLYYHSCRILLSFINILWYIKYSLSLACDIFVVVSPITNLYNRTAKIITIISQACNMYMAEKRQQSEGPSSIEASDSSITLGCH